MTPGTSVIVTPATDKPGFFYVMCSDVTMVFQHPKTDEYEIELVLKRNMKKLPFDVVLEFANEIAQYRIAKDRNI